MLGGLILWLKITTTKQRMNTFEAEHVCHDLDVLKITLKLQGRHKNSPATPITLKKKFLKW